MGRGKLIAIEGTDCSGKETQTSLLIKRLREDGIQVQNFSFPNYNSPTGRIIGENYLGKSGHGYFEEGAVNVDPRVASLYYAADRKYNIDKIMFLLNNGYNVILDRYVYSNMAHQGGKIGSERKRIGLYNYLDRLEFKLLKLPRPDKTIFLHMPYERSLELLKNREKLDDHERNKKYLCMAEKSYNELARRYNFDVIECSDGENIKSIEEINDILYEMLKSVLKR